MALTLVLAALTAWSVSACSPATSADTNQANAPEVAATVQPQANAGTNEPSAEASGEDASDAGEADAAEEQALPRLVDFGAETCIPCREMMPILGKLASDFKGKLEVEVVQVYEEMSRARAAGIRLIPTQVFYAPDGTELSRHEGFMSRDDILKEWARLGYDFGEPESGA